MGWKLAPAIQAYVAAVNIAFPNRSKASDGGIGDAAHRRSKSAHNPDKFGFVCAYDITSKGVDVDRIKECVINDWRTHYFIYNRTIYSRTYGFEPYPYRGSNPHIEHCHLSILNITESHISEAKALEVANSNGHWSLIDSALEPIKLVNIIGACKYNAYSTEPYDVHAVRLVQQALNTVTGYSLTLDGIFGARTKMVYADWQRRLGYRGADADGEPGMMSLKRLGERTKLFRVV